MNSQEDGQGYPRRKQVDPVRDRCAFRGTETLSNTAREKVSNGAREKVSNGVDPVRDPPLEVNPPRRLDQLPRGLLTEQGKKVSNGVDGGRLYNYNLSAFMNVTVLIPNLSSLGSRQIGAGAGSRLSTKEAIVIDA